MLAMFREEPISLGNLTWSIRRDGIQDDSEIKKNGDFVRIFELFCIFFSFGHWEKIYWYINSKWLLSKLGWTFFLWIRNYLVEVMSLVVTGITGSTIIGSSQWNAGSQITEIWRFSFSFFFFFLNNTCHLAWQG